MLSKQKVLNYIKLNVSSVINLLEMTDDEIWNYLIDFTIPEFSSYWPDVKKIWYNFSDPKNISTINNEYYIYDDEGMEILDVVDIIDTSSVTEGHPLFGMSNNIAAASYVYQLVNSSAMHKWGFTRYEFEFLHPNKIRMAGFISSEAVVVYERVHPFDLRTITGHMEKYFLKFALGDIKIILGNKRKKFQNYTTPFGEIPINIDILDEGKTAKQEVIDYLKENVPPYIIIDAG